MPALSVPVTPEDHQMGPASARYTLVEYGDLQCPDTALAEPELAEIMERFGNQLRLVYRHFPLTDLHPQAYRASEATEAAGAQGKFWEMRQQILENQDRLDLDSLTEFAQALGLNVDRFRRDLENRTYARAIDADIQGGTSSGVDSTPCYFLNGTMLDPGLDLFEVFDALDSSDEDEEEEDEEF